MTPTIDTYPAELRGGYYDGAKLIGTREDGAVAEYYNPDAHGVVQYEYVPEKRRLDAEFDPERSLPEYQSIADYIRDVQNRAAGGYDALSDWARAKVNDQPPQR